LCTLIAPRVLVNEAMDNLAPFVRFPNLLLDGLMSAPLTAVQLRVALWVVRNTAGWNQRLTAFSWYAVAKELSLDRAGVWRAGRQLLLGRVLYIESGRVGIQRDPGQWDLLDARRALIAVHVDTDQRKPFMPVNAYVDSKQRDRCREATLFRRPKDSRKNRSKTYKKKVIARQESHSGALTGSSGRRSFAKHQNGGKYDGLSEN
jgi:phage replication O-like protein O